MALLTNINGKFSVDTDGAASFNRIGASETTGFTFPSADGANGEVLKTNGLGTVSWLPDSNTGTVTGTGVANKVAYWTSATNIDDGPITFATNDSTFAGDVSTVGNVVVGSSITLAASNGRVTATQGIFGSAFALTSNGYATFGSTSSSVPIAFAIDGDGSSPEMFIKTDGNVGIGTVSPIKKLDISEVYADSASLVENLQLVIRGSQLDLNPVGDSCGLGFAYSGSTATSTYIKTGIINEFTNSNGTSSLHLCTSAVTSAHTITKADARLTILSGGNVGIGEPNPNYKLNIASATNTDGIYLSGTGTSMTNGEYRQIQFGYSDTDTSYGSTIRFVVPDATTHGGQIEFYTDETSVGTLTRAMTIDNSQNVGIGTATPGTYGPATGTVKLDVLSGDIIRSGFTNPANSWIGFTSLPGYPANSYPSVTSKSSLHFANNDKYCAYLEGADTYFGILNSSSLTKISLNTNGNTYFNGGNVGIGTTSPSSYDGESNNLVIAEGVNGTNPTPGITIACLADQATTGRGAIRFADGAVGNAAYRGALEYNHDGDNMFFRTAGTLKMVLDTSGKLGIGTTATPGRMLEVNGGTTNDGGIKLTTANTTSNYWSGIEFSSTVATSFIYMSADDADGTLKFFPDASLKGSLSKAGTWTVAADVIAYGSPSDKRLKENIKPIHSALDKVMKLKGVTFDWIQKEDQILNIKEDIGFIAQDVQKVIPELVRKNEDGMLSMRHQGIAPILLEAIKELKAEIEELKLNKCNCKCK